MLGGGQLLFCITAHGLGPLPVGRCVRWRPTAPARRSSEGRRGAAGRLRCSWWRCSEAFVKASVSAASRLWCLLVVGLLATSASTCAAGGLLLSWVASASGFAVGGLLRRVASAPISAVGGLLLQVMLLIVDIFVTSALTCTAGGLLLSWVTLASVSAVGRLLS